MEYVRHGWNLSSVSSPLDFNSVSVVRWLVIAFGLVWAVIQAQCGDSAVHLKKISVPGYIETVKRQLQFRLSLRLSSSRLSY
jgi:hypothetical protein